MEEEGGREGGRDTGCVLRGIDRWSDEAGRDEVWSEVGGKYEQYKKEEREGGVQGETEGWKAGD